MKKRFYVVIGLIVIALGVIGMAQLNPLPPFPPNFEYVIPPLPLPQSETQLIFFSCPYKLPLELLGVKVYDVNGTNFNPFVTAEIQVMTNDRRSACSYRKTYELSPVFLPNDLVNNLQGAITADLLNQINANIQPPVLPSPIASTPDYNSETSSPVPIIGGV